ncbi:hypothetical protein ACSBR1_024772 [Camellia fascicularis]
MEPQIPHPSKTRWIGKKSICNRPLVITHQFKMRRIGSIRSNFYLTMATILPSQSSSISKTNNKEDHKDEKIEKIKRIYKSYKE